MPADKLRAMMAAIVGFEIEITAWRETFKLSQNKPADERNRVIEGLESQGAAGVAALMRGLVS
jgi:transcriptional regulator